MKRIFLIAPLLFLSIFLYSAYVVAIPFRPVPLQTYLSQNGGYLRWYAVNSINGSSLKYQVAEFNENNIHLMNLLKYDENSKLVYPIDKLILPPLNKGRIEVMFCKYNHHFDPTVIAWYAHPNPSETTLTNPDKAWRANRKTEKFEVIARTKLVECDRSDES